MAKHSHFYFYFSLAFAIWFALTAYAWTYLMNVFISFPFLILSIVLYRKGLKHDASLRRYKIIPVVWFIGCVMSIAVLIYFLLYE